MKPGETRVIDSNGIMEEKLKDKAEYLFQPDTLEDGNNDGFIPGLNGIEYEEIPGADFNEEGFSENNFNEEPEVDASAKTQELIMEAQAQVEELKQQALQEIENERQKAVEEGKRQGFEEGFKEGKTSGIEEGKKEGLSQIEGQREEMLKGLAIKAAQQEQEYKERLDALEPKMVETLTEIYEKVFQIELKNCKDLVVHLLSNTMHNLEGIKTFLIHVSKEDYPIVSMQKKEIIKGTNIAMENVDIVEDATLSKGECMIETESGIFDCGLGTQLESLNDELTLLSYKNETSNERNEN